jgi:hypothetical protein
MNKDRKGRGAHHTTSVCAAVFKCKVWDQRERVPPERWKAEEIKGEGSWGWQSRTQDDLTMKKGYYHRT